MRKKRQLIWKKFSPAALKQLAVAVALIFSVMGPIQVLFITNLPDYFW